MPRDAIIVPDELPEPAPARAAEPGVSDQEQTRRDFRLAADLGLAMGPMRGFGGSEIGNGQSADRSLYETPALPPEVAAAPTAEPLAPPPANDFPPVAAEPVPVYPLYGLGDPDPDPGPAPTGPADTFVLPDLGLLPGDSVEVRVFGQPELSGTAVVSSTGRLALPLIDDVQVEGLNPEQAAERIEQALKAGGYVVDPQVSVIVERETTTQQVSVLGEVEAPGRYPLEPGASLLDVIAQARGLQESAAESVVVLRRGTVGTRRHYVDLAGMLRDGSEQPAFQLLPNDIIVVPEVQQFYIYGEVRRPDVYQLRPGMTVMQALSIGGGLNERGSDKRIEIRRRGSDGQVRAHAANLGDILQSDDVIYVKERLF